MKHSTEFQSPIQTLLHFFRSVYQLWQIAYDAAPLILVAMMLIRLLQSLVPVVTAYLLKVIFDRLGMVLTGDTPLVFEQDILPMLLAFGGLLTLSQSLIAVDIYINAELKRRLRLYISQLVYQQLLSLKGLAYFESPDFHDTLAQIAGHVQDMPVILIRNVSNLAGDVLTLVSFFGIILVFSPWLTFVLVLSIIPAFLTQLQFRRKRFNLNWDNSPKKRKATYFHRILTQTQYAKEIRLFDLGGYLINKFVVATKDVDQAHRAIEQQELVVNTILNLLSSVVTVGTYIFIIGQAFIQQITLGDVALFIDAVRNVQSRLGTVSSTLVVLSTQTLFFSHYQNLMSFETDLQVYEPTRNIPPLQHKIELKGISFRYDEKSDYVLKDINLTIHKDESIALVGLNGAGKTTLIKLLTRLYDPTDGEILWDGIDIRYFEPDDYRKRIGAVMQDFVKYDVTARENIGLGDTTLMNDMNRIQTAARQVGVDEFLSTLPEGYETVLSRWLVEKDEEGTDLSGGQWQKIAISRTYLRNVDLLMLDEPTSALDAEAEHDIYQRFEEISKDRATILISHRFSTVRMADKIAIIEDGKITEYGTHYQLIAQNGTYAHLYALQAQQYAL